MSINWSSTGSGVAGAILLAMSATALASPAPDPVAARNNAIMSMFDEADRTLTFTSSARLCHARWRERRLNELSAEVDALKKQFADRTGLHWNASELILVDSPRCSEDRVFDRNIRRLGDEVRDLKALIDQP